MAKATFLLNFRGLFYYDHVGERGGKADTVLEKYLKVLHPGLQEAGRETLALAWDFETSKTTTSDILTPKRVAPSNPSNLFKSLTL